MKHFLQNKAGEGDAGGAGSAPDVGKLVTDGFKTLQAALGNLDKRIEAQEKKASTPPKAKAPVVDDEEDLGTELLVNPDKAVKKLTAKIRSEVEGSMSTQSKAKDQFFAKFSELTEQYPELNNAGSDLHVRAKELLASATDKEWDVGALESSVFRAVTEKGVLPMKHRKSASEDEGADDYLGSGGSGANSNKRVTRNDKLDPKTRAFAELLGMNTKDPKVIESLTKTQNDRKGNWNRYK